MFATGLKLMLRLPRFPMSFRGTPSAPVLPRTPSTWTLVHHTEPLPDPFRRGTWGECEPGPQDPSVGSPEVVGPEPAVPAWKRLIDLPPSTEERTSLITTIFSSSHETEVVKGLRGDEAQSVVDVVDEVLAHIYLRSRPGELIFPRRCWIYCRHGFGGSVWVLCVRYAVARLCFQDLSRCRFHFVITSRAPHSSRAGTLMSGRANIKVPRLQ